MPSRNTFGMHDEPVWRGTDEAERVASNEREGIATCRVQHANI